MIAYIFELNYAFTHLIDQKVEKFKEKQSGKVKQFHPRRIY